MRNTRSIFILSAVLALGVLAGCSNGDDPASSETTTATPAVDVARARLSVAAALATNVTDHGAATDYASDTSNAVRIRFNGTSITETSDSVSVNGSVATISAGGVYLLSGSLSNGQIVVTAPSGSTVWLWLAGVSLTNTSTAPVSLTSAGKVILVLAANTQNTVTDGATYVFPVAGTDEPNAAVFSKTDLTICGDGALTVHGNYNDGIASKDGLIIRSGSITVTAADDGIRGKDYLIVRGGTITVTSGGDGLKSDNDEDVARGYILLEAGVVTATSGGDGLAAATDVLVADATCTLTTGGGSSYTVGSSSSAKGIKGTASVVIGNGTFTINAADDAVHSNGVIVINGGTFAMSTSDDGVHADTLLGINGGTITIAKCYEGIESTCLVINDGTIRLTASDDGVNGAGGNDGSGGGGWPGTIPTTGNRTLYMNGGYIAVNAGGDGVDVNGSIVMTGGIVLVHGPTSNGDGPIDYDATFTMSGGVIVAAGSSGMAMAPSASSSQNSVLAVFSTTKSAGTLFRLQGSDSSDVVTFRPAKAYQSVAVCTPLLKKGSTYAIVLGGSSTGISTDGLYQGGTYSGGTKAATFTVSAAVTKVSG
jgi:hypothetical protein